MGVNLLLDVHTIRDLEFTLMNFGIDPSFETILKQSFGQKISTDKTLFHLLYDLDNDDDITPILGYLLTLPVQRKNRLGEESKRSDVALFFRQSKETDLGIPLPLETIPHLLQYRLLVPIVDNQLL